MEEAETITRLPHHIQQKLCRTRPAYRQGKKLTAVKVYTVNSESQHLIISGVPKIGLIEEVTKLVRTYGDVKACCTIPGYPAEEFTEAYHVRYARIPSARIAKRFIDGKNFFGGSLHVFYAPELESVSETKTKLAQRRRDIATRIRKQEEGVSLYRNKSGYISGGQQCPTAEQMNWMASFNGGQVQEMDYPEEPHPSTSTVGDSSRIPALTEPITVPHITTTTQYEQTGISKNDKSESVNCARKRKNYKGRSIRDNVKVRIARPDILDAAPRVSKLKKSSNSKHLVINTKTAEKNIVIKLLPKNVEQTKRIVIKNPGVTRLVETNEDLRSSICTAKSQIRAAMHNTIRAASPVS